MLSIGLLGYGKMGKAIEQIALSEGLSIAFRAGSAEPRRLNADYLRQADVVIEFTRPEAAFEQVCACLEAGVPVVSGTTGWKAQLPEAEALCRARNGALLWSSNFSVGVNLFFALNRHLARLMAPRHEYQPQLSETHHIHKLDAPSGTAITLLEGILQETPRFDGWSLTPTSERDIPVQAIREGEVPGTHLVRWHSAIDEISIEHKAHSRQGFAAGALLTARWIHGKTGVFQMHNVLDIAP
jgi:4-hydroxy-tetrahydrodipicolinate reductase